MIANLAVHGHQSFDEMERWPLDKLIERHDASQGKFDVLFMDAFASDSVPVHLLTREAFQSYFDKLEDDGMVVVNI